MKVIFMNYYIIINIIIKKTVPVHGRGSLGLKISSKILTNWSCPNMTATVRGVTESVSCSSGCAAITYPTVRQLPLATAKDITSAPV
jgi:hypothetical protein